VPRRSRSPPFFGFMGGSVLRSESIVEWLLQCHSTWMLLQSEAEGIWLIVAALTSKRHTDVLMQLRNTGNVGLNTNIGGCCSLTPLPS
jgi:hypothetical protein